MVFECRPFYLLAFRLLSVHATWHPGNFEPSNQNQLLFLGSVLAATRWKVPEWTSASPAPSHKTPQESSQYSATIVTMTEEVLRGY